MAKMNLNLTLTKDYRKNDCLAAQKTNPNKPNFKRDDGFSAYYTKDYHVAEFTLSAAEGGLAITFFRASLQRVAARP